MKRNNQTFYESPEITILEVMLEKGFASSLDGFWDGLDFAPDNF